MRIYHVIVLFLVSCTFEPESDFFVEVEGSHPTTTSFDFFDNEALNFRNTVTLDLRPSSSDEIVGFKFFLNNELLQEGEVPYSLTFDSKQFPDGTYTAKLILTKRSNSQSLGSQLGLEFYQEEVTKAATIFNGKIPKPKIKAFTITDGVLSIEWEKYPRYSFKQYTILSGLDFQSQVITDLNSTIREFPNYVGGNLSFSITVFAYNYEAAQLDTSFNYPLNQNIEKTETGVKFSWDTSPFKNWNGARVAVSKSDGSYDYFSVDKTLNEFTVEKAWTFPHHTQAYIDTRNTVDNSGLTLESKTFSSRLLAYPTSYDNVRNFFVSNLTDTAITIYCQGPTAGSDILVRLNRENYSGELIRKTGIFSSSPDGSSTFEFNNNIIRKIDRVTLESTEEFSVSEIIGTYDQFLQLHVSSDQQILVYVRKGSENWYNVFDWNTKNLVISGTTRADRPLTKFGNLTHIGPRFFPATEFRILGLDVIPNDSRNLPAVSLQVTLPDKMKSIFFSNNELTMLGLKMDVAHDILSTIPYPKAVKTVFTNQQGHVGVAYSENGKIKIDFFGTESLDVLQTLETDLYASDVYGYYFSQNKLVVTGPSPYFNPNIIEVNF